MNKKKSRNNQRGEIEQIHFVVRKKRFMWKRIEYFWLRKNVREMGMESHFVQHSLRWCSVYASCWGLNYFVNRDSILYSYVALKSEVVRAPLTRSVNTGMKMLILFFCVHTTYTISVSMCVNGNNRVRTFMSLFIGPVKSDTEVLLELKDLSINKNRQKSHYRRVTSKILLRWGMLNEATGFKHKQP